jgi:hypothetical protein
MIEILAKSPHCKVKIGSPEHHVAQRHNALNDRTFKAYGDRPTDDLLDVLLALNLELAEKEKHREPIVSPWAPDNPPKR